VGEEESEGGEMADIDAELVVGFVPQVGRRGHAGGGGVGPGAAIPIGEYQPYLIASGQSRVAVGYADTNGLQECEVLLGQVINQGKEIKDDKGGPGLRQSHFSRQTALYHQFCGLGDSPGWNMDSRADPLG